ncbi:tetratricopeptide repeat protein [Methanospirillum sp. J.3.6.1-F.2.7.3]|uniref:Tetratricopeptide repeat protein n=1 Tax=Methanospirillum purgamenti TaxID=2834276 RepID=A0A8E7EKI0_9EURY|nr:MULTISPECIES: tetratricopeptide repeat protein [Methanospirillum]MDX8551903.1 tetratricopeptide repeat protein [Methanospirillum hungatei]QVV89731.1 tetratricopeptide repeat protein [Methanospirillum sp. J.3.6.1-F.2.7.3]
MKRGVIFAIICLILFSFVMIAGCGKGQLPPANKEVIAICKLIDQGKSVGEILEAYDRAAQKYPRFSYLWQEKGDYLSRIGRYNDAVEAYKQALLTVRSSTTSDVESAEIWIDIGKALEMQKKYEEALSAYEEAYKVFSRSDDVITAIDRMQNKI